MKNKIVNNSPDDNTIDIILLYISVWSWHLKAIIFLVSSIIIVSASEDLLGNVFFFVFLFAFLGCELISYSRRKSLKDLESGNGINTDE